MWKDPLDESYSQVPHNGPLLGAVLEWKKSREYWSHGQTKERRSLLLNLKQLPGVCFCIGPKIGLQN